MAVSSTDEPPRYSEDIDSACSTPFVSAPSSPGHGGAPLPSGYFFSAPASPMHFLLSSRSTETTASSVVLSEYEPAILSPESASFEFSSRLSSKGKGPSMTAADELFHNGQIRPMKLSSHLVEEEEEDGGAEAAGTKMRGRDPIRAKGVKYSHRKSRSMSPIRSADEHKADFVWQVMDTINDQSEEIIEDGAANEASPETAPPPPPRSSSSSSGRNSMKWIFLKDLLHRSKSEGRAVGSISSKERFWSSIYFAGSPSKDKKKTKSSSREEKKDVSGDGAKKVKPASGKPANGGVWRRKLSAHEMHYTANRAQAEEMKKKTFLPYRQGLLGCLGFSSKSYGAFSGFTKNLSPIPSR